MLTVGDHAPDFTLPSLDGGSLTLSRIAAQGQHTLIVFLKQLA